MGTSEDALVVLVKMSPGSVEPVPEEGELFVSLGIHGECLASFPLEVQE